MSDSYVRPVGEVSDMNDVRVHIGVDYDTVTVGRYQLTASQAEDFAALFVSAVWQAGQQKARMDGESNG